MFCSFYNIYTRIVLMYLVIKAIITSFAYFHIICSEQLVDNIFQHVIVYHHISSNTTIFRRPYQEGIGHARKTYCQVTE